MKRGEIAMQTTELLHCLDAAQEAARRGAAVLEESRTRVHVHEKGRVDEDKDQRSRPGADAPPTWIVDPLDGTTNYVHDCPLYCVSIGLQVAGEMVVGVVFDPARQEMFAAAQSQGAWLNGRRQRTSAATGLDQALLA